MRRIENCSIYELVQYKTKLEDLQLEEVKPILARVKERMVELSLGKELLGKCYRTVGEKTPRYFQTEELDPSDGSVFVKFAEGWKTKIWICSFYKEDGTYQIYGKNGVIPLEEITEKDFNAHRG